MLLLFPIHIFRVKCSGTTNEHKAASKQSLCRYHLRRWQTETIYACKVHTFAIGCMLDTSLGRTFQKQATPYGYCSFRATEWDAAHTTMVMFLQHLAIKIPSTSCLFLMHFEILCFPSQFPCSELKTQGDIRVSVAKYFYSWNRIATPF